MDERRTVRRFLVLFLLCSSFLFLMFLFCDRPTDIIFGPLQWPKDQIPRRRDAESTLELCVESHRRKRVREYLVRDGLVGIARDQTEAREIPIPCRTHCRIRHDQSTLQRRRNATQYGLNFPRDRHGDRFRYPTQDHGYPLIVFIRCHLLYHGRKEPIALYAYIFV